MHISSVRYPGTWLELDPPEARHDVEALLRNMTTGLAQASIALGWFEEARASHRDPQAEWVRTSALRGEAQALARAKLGGDPYSRDPLEEYEEVQQVALRLTEERGLIPTGYSQQIVFIHAHTFLYALDSIAKSLRVLSKVTGSPAAIVEALKTWDSTFPLVTAIRDTAHHMEDRARGLGRNGKPLDAKPLDHPFASGSGTTRILNSTLNNSYGTTTSTGDFAEVAVTGDSLEAARRTVQDTLDAFTWAGPSRLEPQL